MKKIIISILAVFYLVTTTGATLRMHFCMGEVSNLSFGHKKPKTCGNCGMKTSDEKENGCCKDEQKFVKNTADQKIAETSFEFKTAFSEAVVQSYPELPALQITSISEEYPFSHAPPRTLSVDAYILYQAFLI